MQITPVDFSEGYHNPQQGVRAVLITGRAAVPDVDSCSVPRLPLPTGARANVPGGGKATLTDLHLCKRQTDILKISRELGAAEGKIQSQRKQLLGQN